MLRIIFLDIDGVICRSTSHNNFDKKCCIRLKEILDATDAKIVISSSWRLYEKSLEEVYNQLRQYGIEKEYFAGITSDFSKVDNIDHIERRWLEIKNYIEKNNIKHYIILDDFNLNKFDAENLVQTRMHSGITTEIKDICIQKLRVDYQTPSALGQP